MSDLESTTTDAIADLVQSWRIRDKLLMSADDTLSARLSDGYSSDGPTSLQVTPKSNGLSSSRVTPGSNEEILNRLLIIEHAVSQMRSTVCGVCQQKFTKIDLDYKVMPCLCRYHGGCYATWCAAADDEERKCVSCATIVYMSCLVSDKPKKTLTKGQRSLTDGDLSVFKTSASHK